jgi:hypothetical protein
MNINSARKISCTGEWSWMMYKQGRKMVQSSVITLSYASILLKEFRNINDNNNNILLLLAEMFLIIP